MSDPTTDIILAGLPGLEAALRDAATRALKPDMTIKLALGYFGAVASLAGCVRDYRKAAGLPRELATDLILLLGSVQLQANQRFFEPELTEIERLRLVGVLKRLSRAVILAFPVPEKAEKPAPPRKAPPAPPRRNDDFDDTGAIAAAVAQRPRNDAHERLPMNIARNMAVPRP